MCTLPGEVHPQLGTERGKSCDHCVYTYKYTPIYGDTPVLSRETALSIRNSQPTADGERHPMLSFGSIMPCAWT